MKDCDIIVTAEQKKNKQKMNMNRPNRKDLAGRGGGRKHIMLTTRRRMQWTTISQSNSPSIRSRKTFKAKKSPEHDIFNK